MLWPDWPAFVNKQLLFLVLHSFGHPLHTFTAFNFPICARLSFQTLVNYLFVPCYLWPCVMFFLTFLTFLLYTSVKVTCELMFVEVNKPRLYIQHWHCTGSYSYEQSYSWALCLIALQKNPWSCTRTLLCSYWHAILRNKRMLLDSSK